MISTQVWPSGTLRYLQVRSGTFMYAQVPSSTLRYVKVPSSNNKDTLKTEI